MTQTPTSTSTKPTATPLKSFWAAGPTLHYSHAFVHLFWGLTMGVYVLTCFFWHYLLIGNLVALTGDVIDPSLWNLGRFVAAPISIYEYPWQIVVLGGLMGILATVPVLTAQLYRFRYSLPLLLALMFIAKLYFFGLLVAISCIAVACRPLRFRSRFISVALCMSPQVMYWAIWGGYTTADPIRWGFSYAPWIYAWLTGLFMAAVVLGVGHYTRYRPGLIFGTSAFVLAASFGIFQSQIEFSERDYQFYVARNNPEQVVEFHDYSLTGPIDAVIADDALRSELSGIFYPTERTALREKLKEEIQNLLVYNQWPQWFQRKMPDRLRYRSRRNELLNAYRQFMDRWPQSKRMPNALYFSALLNEYQPDVRYFSRTETLRFYSDYPFKDNMLIWQELLERFPQSPESLEARWRLARHIAAERDFDRAMTLTEVARSMIRQQLQAAQERSERVDKDSIFAAFESPTPTVMSPRKLRDLDLRMQRLQQLMGRENRGPDEASRQRLAVFVGLNPYALDYESRLDGLIREMGKDDPLLDNVKLAKTMLIADPHDRAARLSELAATYQGRDAGIRAAYETAMSLLLVWKDFPPGNEYRRLLLQDIHHILTDFIASYPDSIYVEQAESLLQTLPPMQ
ncbi:MAG: hypothetical protein GXY41_08015 [Phycisphaerae bacterium]|nr:hypothetical protein [Phycisphaerae bacterium]